MIIGEIIQNDIPKHMAQSHLLQLNELICSTANAIFCLCNCLFIGQYIKVFFRKL